MLWRFWRFTVTPILYPDDPKELPYWIPCHGFSFFHNSQTLLARASYFGATKEPFALNVFGSTLYIITDPTHTGEVYKNLDSLSFIEFVQGLFTTNGVSEAGIKAAYMDLPKDKPGFPNPLGQSLGGTLVRQMHIHQLYPGDNLDQLEQRFLDYFNHNVHLSAMRTACAPYATAQTDTFIDIPMMRWCSEYFVRAGGLAYFGPMLSAIDPQLAPTFIAFDDLSWQAIYQYPKLLTRRMRAERDQTQHAFKRYFDLPQSQRTGDAWFTKAMENELRALGVSTDDIAIILLTLHWAINTNTRKTAFWMLTYILHNPHYIPLLRAETAAAFSSSLSLTNPAHLHDSCPLLEAVWFETLRLASNAASVRRVAADTRIGNNNNNNNNNKTILLRKGNRLMIPYRLLHFDEAVYGPDVHAFCPERFLGKENEGLTRGASWRPFGGGKTMCSGRHVAKRATLMFLAMVVTRPVLGVMAVKDDEDYVVRVEERKVGLS
ncbi:putative cytochrome p450 [Bombardia bombarda]|uniref:Cytochrome p450 n=1 Tax=Bombardia bombarda TaxID=252184 RepID=A0AA39WIS9_9PEZI|nr:putative cytochrome p450 [Bombardia bombarda]